MQLKALRLGAMTLAGAVLLAGAPPASHAAAQSSSDPAASSSSEAAQIQIGRDVLDLVLFVGKARERKVRNLRWKYASGVSREYLDSRIAWIEEIESGDPRVMYETALRLRDGDGLPQHRDAAVTWFERAGDHGVPEGLFEASRMLLANPLRDGDIRRSDDFLRRAARKGVAEAQKVLGLQLVSGGARPYRRDRDREDEYRHAYMWLLLAEANGADVGDMFARDGRFLSEQELKMARAILERAAGRILPRYWPAIEDGVPEDWRDRLDIALRWHECERAISILNSAAQTGDTAAEFELARNYETGTCVKSDAAKALEHYEAAAKGGDIFARIPLGLMYYDGRGTPRDMTKARFWFKTEALNLVAESPRRDTRMEIARRNLRLSGGVRLRPFPVELAAAIEWVNGIEDGDPHVLHETALRVRDGDGLPQVHDAAVMWLRLAGKRGVPEANYDLALTLLDAPRGYRDTTGGIRALALAGRDGFVPAQVELGRRYAAGDQVQQWDHAAYVWLLIARENGADVASLLEEVGGRLTKRGRQAAREDASKGTYFPLDSR